MLTLATIVAVIILLPIVAVTAVFSIEVFAGVPRERATACALAAGQTVAIIVPAHDEESVIGSTIARLREQSPGGATILVVADNCTDRTAALAASAGAEVLVRDEPDRRGKGFALAAAREHLRTSRPDIVVIIDADCVIDSHSLQRLIAEAAQSLRPCQAVYLLTPDLSAPRVVQISTFAFMLRNLVRQRGLQRLANRAHMTGTGMAFPWTTFAKADLGGSNIVEDLAMGLALADGPAKPMLVADAIVWSPAASAAGTLIQRSRWEGGFLSVAMTTAPAALMRSLRKGDARGLWAGFELCVPPIALLAVLNGGAFVLVLALLLFGGSPWPLLIQACVGGAAVAAIAAAWFAEGRLFVSGTSLLGLPLYVLWKLPMYFGLFRRGAPKEWLRTGR